MTTEDYFGLIIGYEGPSPVVVTNVSHLSGLGASDLIFITASGSKIALRPSERARLVCRDGKIVEVQRVDEAGYPIAGGG